jgi:uncharacterized protein
MQKPGKARIQPALAAFPVVADGKLVGSRCAQCGLLVFPSVSICSRCLSEDSRPFAFGGDGTIYTYTVLRTAARGWDAPYVLGYVDLPEGVRVFAHLTGLAPDEFQVGLPVRMVASEPVVNFEGMEVVSYKFEAASHASR